MPIDWSSYERFDWAGSSQEPMGNDERAEVAAFATAILALPAEHNQIFWGEASAPGRFAATVVRVRPGIAHRYLERAGSEGISEVALKIFKTTQDARREGQRVVRFHREELHRLPGWPNAHIQKPLCAGLGTAGACGERAYIVQEWVPGNTLDELTSKSSLKGPEVRSIIEQLFGRIVMPLWSKGTIWWDFRDANFCYDATTESLKMIDVDSLAAYAEEILTTPDLWTRREKGRATAIGRLRQMTSRLIRAQSHPVSSREARFRAAWQAELEPALSALSKSDSLDANLSLSVFLRCLESEGLLAAES
jgi:hypothetical protein